MKVPGIKMVSSMYNQCLVKARVSHVLLNSVTKMSNAIKIRLLVVW